MSADVITITTKQIPNQIQVLAEALAMAQRGELRDVIVLVTLQNGTVDLTYAKCDAGDLAVASLILQRAALEEIKAD